MASKRILIFFFLLSLLSIPENAMAQFSPGKKTKEGVAVVYGKIESDTLRMRKSKMETPKRRNVVADRDSVKAKSPSVKRKTGGTVAGKRPSGKKGKSVSSKEAKVDSVKYPKVTYRLGDRIIMRGDSGGDVRNVARILVRKLYMDEDSIIYTKSGEVLYDGELVKAVMRFQRLNDFYEDGIVGYELIKALRKRK